MVEIILEGRENINSGLARLIAKEVERIASTVTKEGEWNDDDAIRVLGALAVKGLKDGETLEQAILRGIQARVEVHGVRQVYAADKEGLVISVKGSGRGDLPNQAQQSRAA